MSVNRRISAVRHTGERTGHRDALALTQETPNALDLLPIDGPTATRWRSVRNNASQGCIILGPALRQQIAASNDHVLVVQP